MSPRRASTARVSPESGRGSHGVTLPRQQPAVQLALGYDPEVERENDEKALRDMFRAAVDRFGGADALRAALGEAPNYIAKITDAMVGTRPVQGRWFLPLLDDENSKPIVSNYFAVRGGYELPQPHREVGRAEIAEQVLAIVLENPVLWKTLRTEAAQRLNLRAEDLQP